MVRLPIMLGDRVMPIGFVELQEGYEQLFLNGLRIELLSKVVGLDGNYKPMELAFTVPVASERQI
jgi:hypothetical protein